MAPQFTQNNQDSQQIQIHKLAGAVDELKSSIWSRISMKNCVIDQESARICGTLLSHVRSLPTLILYDDKGLDLFDKITYTDDYYLTNCEIDIFKRYGAEMTDYVTDGSILVELGVGFVLYNFAVP